MAEFPGSRNGIPIDVLKRLFAGFTQKDIAFRDRPGSNGVSVTAKSHHMQRMCNQDRADVGMRLINRLMEFHRAGGIFPCSFIPALMRTRSSSWR